MEIFVVHFLIFCIFQNLYIYSKFSVDKITSHIEIRNVFFWEARVSELFTCASWCSWCSKQCLIAKDLLKQKWLTFCNDLWMYKHILHPFLHMSTLDGRVLCFNINTLFLLHSRILSSRELFSVVLMIVFTLQYYK